jgi:predicted GIY-YIG superfamily endonuclease
MDSDMSSVILIDNDNDGGSVGLCIQDSPLAKSEVIAAAAEDTKDNSIAEDCINLDDSDDHNGDAKSSSSSSSSSGIPSPLFKQSLAKTAATLDRPPSIIHTANNNNNHNNDTPIRGNNSSKAKKGLTNSKQTVYRKEENSTEDDMSCFTDMSTTSTLSKRGSSKADENDNAEIAVAKKQPANKQQRKKRQWGYKNRKRNTTSSNKSSNDDITTSTTSSIPSTVKAKKSTEEATNKHFHCYLLRSLDPSHPLKTYIGFTTHPQRRIRQHNGILKNGGARRTKKSGRPWTFVCVIHGFQDKITALQFEWAWQNVDKSKAFREAVGDDTLARKMKRRYSPKARLEELRILLKECLPFCLYSLTVYFPEREYHDIFSGILKRGKNGNPYKQDADESGSAYEPLMNIEVCALENMPMAKEVAELKAKKIAKKEAAKALKQSQQKKKVTTNYNSDISDRLENAKALTQEDDSCWSDFLESSDDENDANKSKCSKGNLKTIKEKNDSSSIDLCDISSSSSMDDDEKSRDTMSTSNKYENDDDNDDAVDDISKDLFSMSMGAPRKKRADSDECDFSTISSANDSHCSVDNDVVDSYVSGKSSSIKFSKKGIEKENRPLPSAYDSFYKKSVKATGSMSDDVVDLCDSD